MSVFAHLRAMEQEMEELTGRMSELDHASPEYAQVAERYQRIEHEFTTRDGYAIEAQVGTVLPGLGFRKEDWTRQTEEFSGGWQMRIALAKLLLQQPNLLLLDEPTNHLDLEARNWLEEYLGNYPYAFVLISHDRYFLDVTVNKIVEIWNKRIHLLPRQLRQVSERRRRSDGSSSKPPTATSASASSNWKSSSTASATRPPRPSRCRAASRNWRRSSASSCRRKRRRFTSPFRSPSPAGRIVAEFIGVAKSYGEKEVFRDVNFMIERGDRIALVGVNGAGQIHADQAAGADRTADRRASTRSATTSSPITSRRTSTRNSIPTRAFSTTSARCLPAPRRPSCAACWDAFCSPADDVFKRIGVLSGGERNRYALLRMLLHPANFLLLDEPTNHLDMRAKDVLLKALTDYTGTVVFVSHDRYFIDKLATRVFEVGRRPGRGLSRQLRGLSLAERGRRRGIAESGYVTSQFAAGEWQCQRTAGEVRGFRGQAPESHQAQADGRSRPRT